MKNFKKLLAVLTLTTLTLTSCGDKNEEKNSNNSNPSNIVSIESNEKEEATNVSILIKDTVNDKEILKEDGKIDKDGLQKYLEENHKAKFEDGMMTELEGIKQDKEKNQYWMYYVNGEMAEVGIGDYLPKENDKIEFRFEQM